MLQRKPPNWLTASPGAEIKLFGRLEGVEADILRAAAGPGDSPTDAIKKLLVSGRESEKREQELLFAWKEREAVLNEAARLREDTLRAEIVEGAKAHAAMGRDLARLVALIAQLSQHVALMQSAQSETAHAAKAAAVECGLIRQNILDDLPDLREQLNLLADQTSFLNSFFAALSDGSDPRPAAKKAGSARSAARG